jgi:hypothetical protein
MRWKSLITAFSLAASLAVPALPAEAEAGSCTNVSVPVTLGGAAWRVKGTLCTPDAYTGGVRRVDILVHGGTYNSSY